MCSRKQNQKTGEMMEKEGGLKMTLLYIFDFADPSRVSLPTIHYDEPTIETCPKPHNPLNHFIFSAVYMSTRNPTNIIQ